MRTMGRLPLNVASSGPGAHRGAACAQWRVSLSLLPHQALALIQELNVHTGAHLPLVAALCWILASGLWGKALGGAMDKGWCTTNMCSAHQTEPLQHVSGCRDPLGIRRGESCATLPTRRLCHVLRGMLLRTLAA